MVRVPTNYLITAGIALAVGLWMASGLLRNEPRPAGDSGGGKDEAKRFEVAVVESTAEAITRRIVATGHVRPERSATLRAQTPGQVVEVAAEPGQRVEAGVMLVRLAMDDRQSRLAEAKSRLAERRARLEASQRLGERGFQSKLDQKQAQADLEAARAAVEHIELEIRNTRLTAPFDGLIDERRLDVGDFAERGQAVVTLIDNDPLTAVAELPQQHFASVERGAMARVTLVSGRTHEGRVEAIGPRADAATRTFRVEVAIPNPDGVPAGTSADIELPVGTVAAHHFTPSALTLGDEGQLGVKIVNEADRVEFAPVEIVRSSADGVWVTGLAERARIITSGGGFVVPGERVRAMPDAAVPAS